MDEIIQKLSINFSGNEIIIDHNKRPKVYFHIELKSKEAEYNLKKTFKDFKILH